MKIFRLLILPLLLLEPPYSLAKDDSSKLSLVSQSPLTIAQQLLVKSGILGEEVPINLYLPDNFQHSSADHRYPVIFINDSHGTQFFHTLTGIIKHMVSVERMPEMIVVSLNYGGHIPEIYHNNVWGEQSESTFSAYGNSKLYLQFLQRELFPYLEHHYRALNNRTIIGVSGSSMFPFYTLLQSPELFHHYLFLTSHDILTMGFEKQKSIMDEVIALAKRAQSNTIPVKSLYFSFSEDDLSLQPQFRDSISELNKNLLPLATEDLVIKVDIFTQDGHYDLFIKAILAGIEQRFPKSRWSAKYRDIVDQPGNAMTNIDNHYAALSAEYGFTILPRASRWNSVNHLGFISRYLLQNQRQQEAIEVANRWVQYRPNSTDALIGLADAYEANNQPLLAIDALQKAALLIDTNDLSLHKQLKVRIRNLKPNSQ